MDFSAASDDLRRSAGTGARSSADRRTFSSACNRTDDRAEHGSAANISAGTRIPSDAPFATLQLFIGRAYTIASPCHGDGINVQRNIPIHFNSPRHQSDVRASWNCDRAVGIANIFFDLCREGLSLDDISRIDSLVGPHGHFRTNGKNDPLHARQPKIAVVLISAVLVIAMALVIAVDGVFASGVFRPSIVA